MKQLRHTLTATVLVLSLGSVSYAGTITGSRTGASAARTGTITGSRTGTITGSRTGTITGSRVESLQGSSDVASSGSTQEATLGLRNDVMTKLMMLLVALGW